MSSQLQTTKTLVPGTGAWVVTATVLTGGTLPQAIFLHAVTSVGELGAYVGVTDKSQLTSRAEWTGAVVPTFGNSYVRHTSMQKELATEADADLVISHLVASVTLLSQELQLTPSSTVVHTIL